MALKDFKRGLLSGGIDTRETLSRVMDDTRIRSGGKLAQAADEAEKALSGDFILTPTKEGREFFRKLASGS